MNWVLIAVIAIFAVFGWLGVRKGFIKLVFSLVSTIAALVFATLFSPVVATIMKNNEAVVGFFDDKVESLIQFSKSEETATGSKQESLIDELPLPEIFKESLIEDNTAETYLDFQAENFKQYVCRRITNVIINAIAFVVTLAVAIIALIVLCATLNLIAKLPILHQINTAAGLAAGLAEGLLLVWILFVVVTMFAGSAFGQNALAMIAENPLLDFIYKNNLVSKFIARK